MGSRTRGGPPVRVSNGKISASRVHCVSSFSYKFNSRKSSWSVSSLQERPPKQAPDGVLIQYSHELLFLHPSSQPDEADASFVTRE